MYSYIVLYSKNFHCEDFYKNNLSFWTVFDFLKLFWLQWSTKEYLECQKVTKSSLFFKKFQKFSNFWFTKSRGHLSKKFTILRVLLSKILVSGRKFTKSRMFTI